jgi:uncharacterized protein YjbJ (UPF0337 family)
MSAVSKLRNRFRMGKGRLQARRGRATGNPSLETKGQVERIRGAARQVGAHAKGAAKDVRQAFKE